MPTAWQLAAYLALPNSVAMHRPLLVRRAPGGRCAAGFSPFSPLSDFGGRTQVRPEKPYAGGMWGP